MESVIDKEPTKVNMMSDEDAKIYFELAVQQRLGIPTEEFFKRYEAGEYKNCGIPGITGILALIPLVRNCK